MIKDILGKILDMKKGGNLVVKIELEPSELESGDELKSEGMAPAPKGEGEEKEEMSPSALMDEDEMRMMKKKKKVGMNPRNLAERAKMDSIEE